MGGLVIRVETVVGKEYFSEVDWEALGLLNTIASIRFECCVVDGGSVGFCLSLSCLIVPVVSCSADTASEVVAAVVGDIVSTGTAEGDVK